MTHLKKWARPLVGLGVAVLFVWLAFRNIDWADVGTALSHAALLPLVAAVASILADFSLRTIRWWSMLRAIPAPARLPAAFQAFYGSIAFNNLLPLRAGDVLRTVAFRRSLGVSAMSILGTLVVERLLDLVTLIGIFFVGLAFVPEGVVPQALVQASAAGGVLTFLALVVLVALPSLPQALLDRIAAWPRLAEHPKGPVVREWTKHLGEALGLLKDRKLAAWLLLTSLVSWFLEGLTAYWVAVSLGLDAPAVAAWFAMALGTLATLLPSTPGFVGTYHFFVMLAVQAFGVSDNDAAAFALLSHLAVWLPPTAVGVIGMAAPSGRALREGSDEVEPTA